jgi:hypothetical protein
LDLPYRSLRWKEGDQFLPLWLGRSISIRDIEKGEAQGNSWFRSLLGVAMTHSSRDERGISLPQNHGKRWVTCRCWFWISATRAKNRTTTRNANRKHSSLN